MKKVTKTRLALIASSLLTGAISGLVSNGRLKSGLKTFSKLSAFSAGGLLVYETYKKVSAEVETEVKETEEILEKSGISLEGLTSSSLIQEKEGEKLPIGYTLFSQCLRKYEDSFMEVDIKDYNDVLHIGQKGDKLILAIPLPRTGRNSRNLKSRDVYISMQEYLKEYLSNGEIHSDYEGLPLGLSAESLTIYQVGYEVAYEGDLTVYREIMREEGVKEYLSTLSQIHDAWENSPTFRKEKEDAGVLRYEQYLICEIPCRAKKDNILKVLDLPGALFLISRFVDIDGFDIPHDGTTTNIVFNRLRFHPGMDFSQVYYFDLDEKQIDISFI